MKKKYSKSFYKHIDAGSQTSANVILEILSKLIPCRSVIDIGCGAGSWLSVAKEKFKLQEDMVIGIDGEYSRNTHESLNGINFLYQDLRRSIRIPDKKFDLLICVEVVEHLPIDRAATIVKEMTDLSDVIIFSAAIPGQGGTGHTNEQWPEYWRDLFAAANFQMYDVFRSQLWANELVAPWYAQNCFLYVKNKSSVAIRMNEIGLSAGASWPLRCIHPGVFAIAGTETAGASRLLKALPRSVLSAVKRRIA